MSPRKSSTSSGKPVRRRSRYLGLEVAGVPLPPRALEAALRESFRAVPGTSVPRVIRVSAGRALVEVGHREVAAARSLWNGAVRVPSGEVRIATRKTWGTLRKGKVWLSNARPRLPEEKGRK